MPTALKKSVLPRCNRAKGLKSVCNRQMMYMYAAPGVVFGSHLGWAGKPWWCQYLSCSVTPGKKHTVSFFG